MAAAKRNILQIERDRQFIAELYLKGKSQAEIARIISEDPDRPYTLTQAIICRDIAVVRRQWAEKSSEVYTEQKAVELAKIDSLEREYWRKYELLQIKKAARKAKGEKPSAKLYAEAKYLAGVQWCIDRRCQLLGLDAPKRMDVRSTSMDKIPFGQLTKDQLTRITNGEDPEKVIPGLKFN